MTFLVKTTSHFITYVEGDVATINEDPSNVLLITQARFESSPFKLCDLDKELAKFESFLQQSLSTISVELVPPYEKESLTP